MLVHVLGDGAHPADLERAHRACDRVLEAGHQLTTHWPGHVRRERACGVDRYTGRRVTFAQAATLAGATRSYQRNAKVVCLLCPTTVAGWMRVGPALGAALDSAAVVLASGASVRKWRHGELPLEIGLAVNEETDGRVFDQLGLLERLRELVWHADPADRDRAEQVAKHLSCEPHELPAFQELAKRVAISFLKRGPTDAILEDACYAAWSTAAHLLYLEVDRLDHPREQAAS